MNEEEKNKIRKEFFIELCNTENWKTYAEEFGEDNLDIKCCKVCPICRKIKENENIKFE